MIRIPSVLLALIPSAVWADGPPSGPDLKAEFQRYYERRGYPESWSAAMGDLGAADENKWKPAAEKLLAVLAQAKADEDDGTSPWRATPYWGSPGENPARELRGQILRELAGGSAKPGAVALVRWYVFQDPVRGHQAAAMAALRSVATPEADALRREVLKARPENARVLAAALRQARERQLAAGGELLTELARHHRPSLRTAAAEWLRAEGKPVPAFDPAEALRVGPAKAVVEQLAALWPDIPAADARPLTCRESLRYDGQTADLPPEFVWPVGESKTALRTVDLHGRLRAFDLAKRDGSPKAPRETAWRTEPADLEAQVKAVAALRARGNPDFALSAQGGLTGQFEGNGPSLPELLLGVWLCKANRHDLAAAVLIPALDAADTDAGVVETARQRLAIVYGQAMLNEFTFARNYPEALRLAQLTDRLYPKTTYSEHARRLARELPLRRDDFGTFALPTPPEWAALKPTLTREQQVHYLCDRLRLLNCFQHGQPGGVDYYDPQFKEPGPHGQDGDKATAVINPLAELGGDPGSEWRKRPKTDGLKLTLADVPALAEHLRDDWTMVMVSYWRDFHPGRTLHPTREVVAGLIHRLAKQDLCLAREMAKMSPEEADRHIGSIQVWARDRAGRSEADLNVEALEKAVREDERWGWNAEKNAAALAELKDRRVVPLALQFLGRERIDNYDFKSILVGVAPLDPVAFRPHALRMLDSADHRYQLWAACLLVAADEPDSAFDRIEALIPSPEVVEAGNWRYALEVLLAAKSDRANPLVRKIIAGRRVTGPFPSGTWELQQEFVPRLYNGGYREEVLKLYDGLLGDDGSGNSHRHAAELLELLKDSDGDLRALADRPGEPGDKLPELKGWIASRLAGPSPAGRAEAPPAQDQRAAVGGAAGLLTVLGWLLLVGGAASVVAALAAPGLLLGRDFWRPLARGSLGRAGARAALVAAGLGVAAGGGWILWG